MAMCTKTAEDDEHVKRDFTVMCVRDAGDYQVLQRLFANVILCLIFNLMGVDVFL